MDLVYLAIIVMLLVLLMVLVRQKVENVSPTSYALPSAQTLPAPQQSATWQCQVDGGGWVNFSEQISRILETHYTQSGGGSTVKYTRDSIPYQADFSTMQQQRIDGQYSTKRAIRRQAAPPPLERLSSSQILAQQLKLPSTWSNVKDPVVAERVDLPTGAERDNVVTAFMQTLSKPSLMSGGIRVVSVQRIQNVAKWRHYATMRWDVVSREGPQSQARYERVWLFHGTDEDTAEKIIQQGFNRSFAGKNATAFGKGVYFARDASYSAQAQYSQANQQGVQHMFLCRVVVGDYCVGSSGALTAPVRTGNILYDSTVDNVGNPSIFVTYHDAQAYPEYLVRFRKVGSSLSA